LVVSYRDPGVYKLAMQGAIRVFHMTKTFPADEKLSLPDQTLFAIGVR
jgi:hypothetical protein